MKDCRRCGSSLDDGAQFCPDCGAPQTDTARAELADLARDELEPSQLPSGDGGGGNRLLGEVAGDPDILLDRVAYAVGFVTLVLALGLLFDPAAAPLFLAGLVILPPMRYLLAKPFGRPFIREFMIGLYAVFAVVGGALFVLL